MRDRPIARALGYALVGIATSVVVSCGDTDQASLLEPHFDLVQPEVTAGQYWVCKFGNFASLTVSVDKQLVEALELAPNECQLVYEASDLEKVVVTETPADQLYALEVTTLFPGGGERTNTFFGRTRWFADIGGGWGAVVTFYNYAGCTSYWKNNFGEWPDAYSPNDDFDSTFGVDLFGRDITLGQAARRGRGIGELARQATYALLNAEHPNVNYRYAAEEVISMVQNGEQEDVDRLASANAAGCVLSARGSGDDRSR